MAARRYYYSVLCRMVTIAYRQMRHASLSDTMGYMII